MINMEFSHLLAELKNASEEYGKQTSDNTTATNRYCNIVCKVATNLESQIENYENQVIGLWVIFGYITELYPQLEKGAATKSLCQKLFGSSARIVLDVQWGQLDEDRPYKNNFQNTLTGFHELLKQSDDNSRFEVILSLMETHWSHPVLGQVMSSEGDEDDEGLNYICNEDPDILRLRVELMLQQNCEEFALNLCTWCLKHPALKFDLDIRQIQLTLMNKLHDLDRLQEEAETIPVDQCVELVKRFQKLSNQQKMCTLLTQTFLVQNWIKSGNEAETMELLRLWIQHQYTVDQDEEKFISNLWAIAKLSRTTQQITEIIDCIREKCGDSLLQFYTDMCVYAINIDKGVLEKSIQNGDMAEIQSHQQDMALTCCKLSDIFRKNNIRTARYSIVTAFSLNPSKSTLEKVASFYMPDASDGDQDSEEICCGNCTFQSGECSQKRNRDKKERINPATLYEVERLLSMLRPYNLKPDMDWKDLGSACTKYLQERERIIALMEQTEAQKKVQPDHYSHQELAASLRQKLLVTSGHNKPQSAPVKPVEKTEVPPAKPERIQVGYSNNLQQVVENLQKRLGKSPNSIQSTSKVKPRTAQSINLAHNAMTNMGIKSENSGALLPTASQVLANKKKSDAETIRLRTTQQIAATIQQKFLRNSDQQQQQQQQQQCPKYVVQVQNYDQQQQTQSHAPRVLPIQSVKTVHSVITSQNTILPNSAHVLNTAGASHIQQQQQQQHLQGNAISVEQRQLNTNIELKSPIVYNTQKQNLQSQSYQHVNLTTPISVGTLHQPVAIQQKNVQSTNQRFQIIRPTSEILSPMVNTHVVSNNMVPSQHDVNRSKMKPLTSSQVQLIAQAKSKGYETGKAVVKILQSPSIQAPISLVHGQAVAGKMNNIIQYTSGIQTLNVVAGNKKVLNAQHIANPHVVTISQPQNIIQQTVVSNPVQTYNSLPANLNQATALAPQIYQTSIPNVVASMQVPVTNLPGTQIKVAGNPQLLTTQLNQVQTDLNTLLTAASSNARSSNHQNLTAISTNSSIFQSISTAPVYTQQQSSTIQSDLNSIVPTIPHLDAHQFQDLQNQIHVNQGQRHLIQAPNMSAEQLQEELNKINNAGQPHQQQSSSLNPAVRNLPSNNHPKVQQRMPQKSVPSVGHAIQPKLPFAYTNEALLSNNSSTVSSSKPVLSGIKPNTSTTLTQPPNLSLQKMLHQTAVSQKTTPEPDSSKTAHISQPVSSEQILSEKSAVEQKNLFVKSLLNASDEILETLAALPETGLISDLFSNAKPGDELHIALSDNIEDLGLDDDVSSMLLDPSTDTLEKQDSNQKKISDKHCQANQPDTDINADVKDSDSNFLAAQSLHDVQGIVTAYHPQYQQQDRLKTLENSHHTGQVSGGGKSLATVGSTNSTKYVPKRNETIKIHTSSKKSGSVFKCIICSAVFPSLESLQYHVQRVCKSEGSSYSSDALKLHDSKGNYSGMNAKTIYQCVKCSSICISEREMQLHTKNCPKISHKLILESQNIKPVNRNDSHPIQSSLKKAGPNLNVAKRIAKQQKEMKKEKQQQLKKIQAQKVLQKQKELKIKREKQAAKKKGPPPPQYKEMTSSSGKTFYKCELCGQTFCSPEGVQDHWLPCLEKNPLKKKKIYRRKVNVDQKQKQNIVNDPERISEIMTDIFDTVVGPGIKQENSNTSSDETNQSDIKVNETEESNSELKSEEQNTEEKDTTCSEDDTKYDTNDSGRNLRDRSDGLKPRYKFSSDSDEDLKRAKQMSMLEYNSSKETKEKHLNVDKAKLKKATHCLLCSIKLKDISIKLQHFAVKHLKVHTHFKSCKGHTFSCHMCNVKFNVYKTFVFHLLEHENEILERMVKKLEEEGVPAQVSGRQRSVQLRLQMLAARKSVRKHLSPHKKFVPSSKSHDGNGVQTRGNSKMGDIQTRMGTRKTSLRAAHQQALNKIKNNANGFDILNTLPDFNSEISSSSHSRSCSPEQESSKVSQRTRKLSIKNVENESSDTVTTDHNAEKGANIESESQDSATYIEPEKTSESESLPDESSGDEFVQEPESSDQASQDSDGQLLSSPDKDATKNSSFLTSYLSFLGDRSQENKNETYENSIFFKTPANKSKQISPTPIRQTRHSMEGPCHQDSSRKSKSNLSPNKPPRRMSDSELITQHSHLLENGELRVMLTKLSDSTIEKMKLASATRDGLPLEEKSEVDPTSTDSLIDSSHDDEMSLSSSRPDNQDTEKSIPLTNPTLSANDHKEPSLQPDKKTDKVEVLLMDESSPSQIISSFLQRETLKISSFEEKREREDQVVVDGSLTDCFILNADQPSKNISKDLIILHNNNEDHESKVIKSTHMAGANVEIIQNDVKEIIEGATISVLGESGKLQAPISSTDCPAAEEEAEASAGGDLRNMQSVIGGLSEGKAAETAVLETELQGEGDNQLDESDSSLSIDSNQALLTEAQHSILMNSSDILVSENTESNENIPVVPNSDVLLSSQSNLESHAQAAQEKLMSSNTNETDTEEVSCPTQDREAVDMMSKDHKDSLVEKNACIKDVSPSMKNNTSCREDNKDIGGIVTTNETNINLELKELQKNREYICEEKLKDSGVEEVKDTNAHNLGEVQTSTAKKPESSELSTTTELFDTENAVNKIQTHNKLMEQECSNNVEVNIGKTKMMEVENTKDHELNSEKTELNDVSIPKTEENADGKVDEINNADNLLQGTLSISENVSSSDVVQDGSLNTKNVDKTVSCEENNTLSFKGDSERNVRGNVGKVCVKTDREDIEYVKEDEEGSNCLKEEKTGLSEIKEIEKEFNGLEEYNGKLIPTTIQDREESSATGTKIHDLSLEANENKSSRCDEDISERADNGIVDLTGIKTVEESLTGQEVNETNSTSGISNSQTDSISSDNPDKYMNSITHSIKLLSSCPQNNSSKQTHALSKLQLDYPDSELDSQTNESEGEAKEEEKVDFTAESTNNICSNNVIESSLEPPEVQNAQLTDNAQSKSADEGKLDETRKVVEKKSSKPKSVIEVDQNDMKNHQQGDDEQLKSNPGKTQNDLDMAVFDKKDKKLSLDKKTTNKSIVGKRSGLIRALREQIKPESFTWDLDEEENQEKKHQSQLSDHLIQDRAVSTPFTWDVSSEDDAKSSLNKDTEPKSDSHGSDLIGKNVSEENGKTKLSKCSKHTVSTSHTQETTNSSTLQRSPEKEKITSPTQLRKCQTRSSSRKPSTTDRVRLIRRTPSKYRRISPTKNISPLRKSITRLQSDDSSPQKRVLKKIPKSGNNVRSNKLKRDHPSKNSEEVSKKVIKLEQKSECVVDNTEQVKGSVVETKPVSKEIIEHEENHGEVSGCKSPCQDSSREENHSEPLSPIRRSKRRLERLHRKLCCDNESHVLTKRHKADDSKCHHGPSSACSSCSNDTKQDSPLPAVVRRSSNYRRHSYQHLTDIPKEKERKMYVPSHTKSITMIRVDKDLSVKDVQSFPKAKNKHLPALSSEEASKQGDQQDSKWKFRPRNKNKKYPFTFTRAREKKFE